MRLRGEALPLLLAGGVTGFAVAGVALIVAADSAMGWTGFETADVVVFTFTFPVLPVMGVLLVRRRPENPIGWLFLLSALGLAVAAFAHGYGDYGIDARPGSLPGAAFVTWWTWTAWVAFGLLAVFVPLLFPTGKLPSARWKPVAVAGTAAVAVLTVGMALEPGHLRDFHSAENPFGVASLDGPLGAVEAVARPLLLGALVAGLVSLVVRYRMGNSTLRRQLKWLAYATGVLVVADVIGNVALGGSLNDHPAYCTWGTTATKPVYGTVVPALLYAGLPAAVAVAVLRHNLYGIERLIRRSAVYAVLWVLIAVVYTGMTWAFGVAVTGTLPVSVGILVTIVVTLGFQPVRRRLERVADRWVFGRRPSGYEVASGFGARLGAGSGLEDLVTSLAGIVRTGLARSWARVSLELPAEAGALVASAAAGDVDDGAVADLAVPVMHRGRPVGTIECGTALDARREPESRALLDLLAHEASLAVDAIGLARELAASRARIVTAQEAERRRVERDIHDGAQQELVAILAKLGMARGLVGRDPAAAALILGELQHDAQAALRGIRELAQGLHPSVLGDAGLVVAIEDRTGRLPLPVHVFADESIRATRFSNSVEGAAFFVVSEALTNVLKHARAGRATVAVSRHNGSLVVQVDDDGCGFEPAESDGDGLTLLADRVGALGGELRVRSSRGAGATLTATLPIGDHADHG